LSQDEFGEDYSGDDQYDIHDEYDQISLALPLMAAVLGSQVEAVKVLLKLGAHPDPTSWNDMSALIMAARKGQLETVVALLEAGAAIEWESASGFTALTMAAYEGYVDIVQRLIQAGADIHACTCDGYGNNAFDFAHLGMIEGYHKGGQHLEIIALLETAGAERTWEKQSRANLQIV
jgi:ankyrin repeat protein